MNSSLWILLISTLSIAFVHALAPDHWMPFAAIAKAKKWPGTKLFWVTLISGIGHVGSALFFSVIGLALGFSLSKLKHIEGHRGEIALWLLIGFGIAYMLWGFKKAREHDYHNHHHQHINEKELNKKTVAMWTMFAIVVLGPCEPLVPLVFLGYNYGWPGVLMVSAVFSVVTIIMMLAQSILAFKGIQLLKGHVVEKYSHAFAGFVIALTGIFVLVVGI